MNKNEKRSSNKIYNRNAAKKTSIFISTLTQTSHCKYLKNTNIAILCYVMLSIYVIATPSFATEFETFAYKLITNIIL